MAISHLKSVKMSEKVCRFIVYLFYKSYHFHVIDRFSIFFYNLSVKINGLNTLNPFIIIIY